MSQKIIYEGICLNGPLDGVVMQSRFPKGFLLVDKPNNVCWVYEWRSVSNMFQVRTTEPMVVAIEGRIRAAEESNYDVIAAPWVGELNDYISA